MPRYLKFLTLAVRMGKISEATRSLVLNNQVRRRSLGERHVRAGDLSVQLGVLTESARDEVLTQQEVQKKGDSRSFSDGLPRPTSTMGWQLLIALLAILAVAVAFRFFDQPLVSTVTVVGFVTYVLETLLHFASGRSLALAFQRAAFPLGLVVVFSLVLFATVSIFSLKHEHNDLEEVARIWTIELAFSSMGVAVIMLLLYSLWKFHALRYSESRLGAIKDILIRIENILRNHDQPVGDRQRAAITVVLKGLRNAIRLNPTDRVMRLISFFRPSFNQTRILYFVPEPTGKAFRLANAAYPEEAPERVREAYEWMREHHHPSALNRAEFERLRKLAMGASPKHWKARYLNMPERYQHVSVCGWIYHEQEILSSSNVSECLEFDDSFLEKLKSEGFETDVLKWLEAGSFVGCRIVDSLGAAAGVLLVVKNIRKGFPPEDLEVVITASQLLGRILQAT